MIKRYDTLLITVYVFLVGYNKRGVSQYRVYVKSNRCQSDEFINDKFNEFAFDNSLVSGKKNMLKRFNTLQRFIYTREFEVAVKYAICGNSIKHIVK